MTMIQDVGFRVCVSFRFTNILSFGMNMLIVGLECKSSS